MNTGTELLTSDDFAPGGPSNRLAECLGLSRPSPTGRTLKVGLVFLITWVPLLVLSWVAGHASGNTVHFTFLRDLDAYVRFLFALPMLELGAVLAATLLPFHLRHFVALGLIPERDRSRFEAAQIELMSLRDSKLADGVKLVLSCALPLGMRFGMGYSVGDSSWERVGATITLAGWWYILVSLPLLYFFALRRLWGFLLWSWFLFRVSRLDLELSAAHPDRAGGLGFVARGQVAFSLLLMAFSAIISAGFGEEILNRGRSLNDLKYHVALFVILALVILHAPLLAFSRRMIRCRYLGLLGFAELVLRCDRAFDEKWIERSSRADLENLPGRADVRSFADVATSYGHVEEMRAFPFDTRAFVILLFASLVPMIPLLGATIPLKEILMKLGEMMV